MDAAQLWTYLVVALPGVWAVWKRWDDRRKQNVDLAAVAQKAVAGLIEDLRKEVDRLRKELDNVRREHSEMIASKDAEITMLRAEIRQKEAVIEGYERVMRKAGIKPPVVSQAFWEVTDGKMEPQGLGGAG